MTSDYPDYTNENNIVREESRASISVNKDQTQGLNSTNGFSQTTIITPPAGEMWELDRIELHAATITNSDIDTTEGHEWSIDTEQHGVNVGYAREGNAETTEMTYKTGQWTTATEESRDHMEGTKSMPGDGLAVTYSVTNADNNTEQANDRTIRATFHRTKQ